MKKLIETTVSPRDRLVSQDLVGFQTGSNVPLGNGIHAAKAGAAKSGKGPIDIKAALAKTGKSERGKFFVLAGVT